MPQLAEASPDASPGPRTASGRRPTILFVTITFDPEPGALRGLPLAKWLMAHGYDVKVLTSFPQYPLGRIYPGYRTRAWQREVMSGVPVLRVPIYPSHDTNPLRRIATYISFMLSASTIGVSLIGPGDIIFLYEPPPTNGLPALLLSWINRAPIVQSIADMWPDTVLDSGMVPDGLAKRIVRSVIGAWCRLLYKRASVVTVLSPGFKRLLAERGVPDNKTHVINNWTDEEVFRPVPRNDALADELGFTGKFTFLYAGNMGPMQGLETVVHAAVLVRDDPRIQIVLMGAGPHESDLRRLVAELDATNIRFIPRREYWEMPEVNAVADVLVVHLRDFPFLAWTVPSKTQVGLASAKPLLMALHGDTADMVRDAEAGIICKPDDPQAMARAMRQFASMPTSELEAMGERGRQYYHEHLSLEMGGGQMDAIFRRLLEPSQ
jgi:glycosyltransferase involved in cell wall biosynthesis